MKPTPVKLAAAALNVPVLEPERLSDVRAILEQSEADFFVVASYGKIVPQWVLDIPRRGALNVHPSLLPLYRGATPLQSAIRDGRSETGVTVILMDAGMDTGDIVLQERARIADEETYGELHDRLAQRGAELLGSVIAAGTDAGMPRTPQATLAPASEIAATLTKPLTAADLLVSWDDSAASIVNRVRAYSPLPAARAELHGQRIKIVRAHVAEGAGGGAPGEIFGVDGDAALVAAGEGAIALERLVVPNRAPMSGAEFARSPFART